MSGLLGVAGTVAGSRGRSRGRGRQRCRHGEGEGGREVACVSSKGLAFCVGVNGRNVHTQEGGKSGDAAVLCVWVGSDIIGDVLCECRERGDEGFSEKNVALIDRNGVVSLEFADIQLKLNSMIVKIVDFGQWNVEFLSERCQIALSMRTMSCHHFTYDIIRGEPMEPQNWDCDRSLVS